MVRPDMRDAEVERLTFALMGTRLGLWDWDMVTGETVFNQRWAEIVGYDLDELQPTTIDTWLRMAHPDDLPASEAAIEAHVRGETPTYDVEVRMLHRDGHTVWVHDRGQVVAWNEDGTPRRMVGTHEDVTDRVEEERLLAESEQQFASMFYDHDAVMLLVDPDSGQIIDVNEAACRFYGYDRSELTGMPISEINMLPPEDVAASYRAAADRERSYFVFPHRLADGTVRSVEVHSSPIRHEGRSLLFSVIIDVTQREAQAEELREAAAVFDAVSEGVLISDRAGIVTRANAAWSELTGFPAEAIVGRHARDIIDPAVSDERAVTISSSHLAGHGSRDEVSIMHADGTTSPALVTVSPIEEADGAASGYVTLIADISQHVAIEKATLDLATTVDHVTGLANRRGFAAAIGKRLQHRRRTDAPGAVLIVDLDRFKDINDSFGTGTGDIVLRTVAERLADVADPDDVVARLGSDEFAMFVQSVRTDDEAERVASSIQLTLGSPIAVAPEAEVFVTASIGVCLTSPGTPTPDEALQRAAAALSDAKRAGPGTIRHHDVALTTVSRARLDLETRLRHAWEDGDFVVHYQPQVDVGTERIVGAEALVRWPTEGGGQVPPGSFIPLAERIGLITDLGAWVLDQACAQAHTWQLSGLPELTIAVNVSARQMVTGTFADRVHTALLAHDLAPHLLELELTESALLETGDRTLGLLGALNALGVRLSIDDFGTGYSSFAYLKRFPLDQLKVDMSFVADLETDPDARAITAAIVGLGHTLGLTVLAEGVETPGQLSVLRAQTCNQFQGYLVSPALPPDAFADLVRASL